MKSIMIVLILALQIFAEYEPVPFFGDINWEQLVPLFQILLPYLFVIGFPILLVLVIYSSIKIFKFGGLWLAGLIGDIFSKDKDEEDE